MMHWVRKICLAVLLCILPCFVLAVETALADEICIVLSCDGGNVNITPTVIDDEKWLFLPSFAKEASILQNGKTLEVRTVSDTEEHVQLWQLWRGEEMIDTLHVMRGENLRAFFLFSDDPVHRGRSWVESDKKHQNETQGGMAMVNPDGKVDHAGRLKQIRGRGNGTWYHMKRPYQIKLVDEVNLLNTGVAEERNQTWVLLAENTDTSLLHNRIALDLALEIGMEETSKSEFVDLYYDGEYCGVYLLAEKVEIGPGRVDEVDYDELINTWNKRVGKKILDILPVGQAVNRYGNPYTYIEGVGEKAAPGAGSFLLEREHLEWSLTDRCWFETSDGVLFASKNPENASQSMMCYISEKLESALRTLKNGGINPETGRTTAEEFDLDSFARLALVGEMAYNIDALTYSSTWFVLPAGEEQFRAGPVWDYDLAWRYLTDGSNQDAQGLKERKDWVLDLYNDPAFMACMRQIWTDEMAPLVEQVLLGQQEGQYLKPLGVYHAQVEASRRMNEKCWYTAKDSRLVYGNTMQEEVDMLERFIRQRSHWLSSFFAGT